MRKIKLLSLLLALCLLFCSFVGCSKDVDEKSSSSMTESSTDNAANSENGVDKNMVVTETNGISIKHPKIVANDEGTFEIIDIKAAPSDNYVFEISLTLKRLTWKEQPAYGPYFVDTVPLIYLFLFDKNNSLINQFNTVNYVGFTDTALKMYERNVEFSDTCYVDERVDEVESTAIGKTFTLELAPICPADLVSTIEIVNYEDIKNAFQQ